MNSITPQQYFTNYTESCKCNLTDEKKFKPSDLLTLAHRVISTIPKQTSFQLLVLHISLTPTASTKSEFILRQTSLHRLLSFRYFPETTTPIQAVFTPLEQPGQLMYSATLTLTTNIVKEPRSIIALFDRTFDPAVNDHIIQLLSTVHVDLNIQHQQLMSLHNYLAAIWK
jgi:hypothetical protein